MKGLDRPIARKVAGNLLVWELLSLVTGIRPLVYLAAADDGVEEVSDSFRQPLVDVLLRTADNWTDNCGRGFAQENSWYVIK